MKRVYRFLYSLRRQHISAKSSTSSNEKKIVSFFKDMNWDINSIVRHGIIKEWEMSQAYSDRQLTLKMHPSQGSFDTRKIINEANIKNMEYINDYESGKRGDSKKGENVAIAKYILGRQQNENDQKKTIDYIKTITYFYLSVSDKLKQSQRLFFCSSKNGQLTIEKLYVLTQKYLQPKFDGNAFIEDFTKNEPYAPTFDFFSRTIQLLFYEELLYLGINWQFLNHLECLSWMSHNVARLTGNKIMTALSETTIPQKSIQ